MKKILLVLLLLSGIANAQIVVIPDASFKAELIADGVDTNTDGEIQVIEALATTTIDLSNSAITDLTGIEAFTNLESFTSDELQITSLDFSSNIHLNFIECSQSSILNVINITSCTALEELRIFGSAITTLDCSFNTNLTALYIAGNPSLEQVFIKNGSDESLTMGSGSWLENWLPPNNPNLVYVCADEFQTTEIQQIAGSAYPANSYCTFPPGGDVNTITGITQFDDENDGCDVNDTSIPFTSFNISFNGSPTNVIAYSNNQGIYNVYAGETGDYTLFPNLENPTYFTIDPISATVPITVIDNSTITQNFCVDAEGIHPDLEVVIAPITPARPGFEATYSLFYKNKGNQTLSGDVQFNYDEDRMDFVSSSTVPDLQTDGLLVYNFVNLAPYQTKAIQIALDVNSPTDDPPVNIDDVLVLFAEINPIAGDENPFDNTFTLDQIVVGAFDPNNIVCIQGEEVPSSFIGEYLHYVINFENTGNFPAENVVVTMDIDPTNFNPESMQILDASHNMEAVMNNNIVEFHFQNINLDTGGHGNILLKMRTHSDLTINDQVKAQAKIYFDFNFPIETNEAFTSFRELSLTEFNTAQVSVFPNPSRDIVNIKATHSNISTIGVYDLLGRKIKEFSVNKEDTTLSISALKSGIYFFKIKVDNHVILKKVVKQ